MGDENRKVLSFGPFELSIDSRRLTNGTKAVPLGARAMDILISLVEQPSTVVGKRDLIEQVSGPTKGPTRSAFVSTSRLCERPWLRATPAGVISQTYRAAATASSSRSRRLLCRRPNLSRREIRGCSSRVAAVAAGK